MCSVSKPRGRQGGRGRAAAPRTSQGWERTAHPRDCIDLWLIESQTPDETTGVPDTRPLGYDRISIGINLTGEGPMPTSIDELRSFHEFVGRKLAEGGSDPLSPQDCLDLWLFENQMPEERSATLEAIRQGLDDLSAGRTRPAEDVLGNLCRKHGLSLPR